VRRVGGDEEDGATNFGKLDRKGAGCGVLPTPPLPPTKIQRRVSLSRMGWSVSARGFAGGSAGSGSLPVLVTTEDIT